MSVRSASTATRHSRGWARAGRVVRAGGVGFAILIVLGSILGLVGIGPVAFVVEAIDMPRLRATTQATIESVRVEGRGGTARPVVQYTYSVEGTQYTATNFSPGFFSNGRWTGGRSAARAFRPGDIRDIHYNPASPAHACLLYGWHQGTLVFTAFSTLVLIPLLTGDLKMFRGREKQRTGSIIALWILPAMFGPSVVPPSVVMFALPAPFLLFLALTRIRPLERLFRARKATDDRV